MLDLKKVIQSTDILVRSLYKKDVRKDKSNCRPVHKFHFQFCLNIELKNYVEIINKFENTLEKPFNWFQCNKSKANAYKCYLFSSHYKPITIKIKESAMENFNSEKFLGLTTDSKWSLDDHITNLSRKKSQKLMQYLG